MAKKTYEVELTYTCQTTYNNTVTIEADSEEDAEDKALIQAKQNGVTKDWEQDEDDGDFEVLSIEEVD